VKPQYSLNERTVGLWVGQQAKSINRPSIDATLTVKNGKPKASKEQIGRKVDKAKAREMILSAVQSDNRAVKLPVATLKPKVYKKDLPQIIIVDKSERQLTLYKGDKKRRSWGCAIGQPQFPTPEGRWTIINKRYMPTWTNPGSAWAASMPPYIAPGYSNPLGLRALDLDASGIRIHGTANVGSIGTAASHGCIRMANEEVVQLFPLVDVGTSVYVVP
jgi:lipoprotein-anchoring transpeptidase ErfK/SrfK